MNEENVLGLSLPTAISHSRLRSSSRVAGDRVGDIVLASDSYYPLVADELTLVKGHRVQILKCDIRSSEEWWLGLDLTSGKTGLLLRTHIRSDSHLPNRQLTSIKFGWEFDHVVLNSNDKDPLSVEAFLGHGSIGVVEEVKRKGTFRASFVRKRVQLPYHRRQDILRIIKAEAKTLAGLKHLHIVEIIGSYEDRLQANRQSYCLLMAPVGENDLGSYLAMTAEGSYKVRAKERLCQWFTCLTSALAYMHAQGIRHQDIKPSNIIHKGGVIFFTDFSSAGTFQVGQTTSTTNSAQASPMYAAPEIIDRFDENGNFKRHGRGSDIFSLGCVFSEMLSVLDDRPVSAFQEFILASTLVQPEMQQNGGVPVLTGRLLYWKGVENIHQWFNIGPVFNMFHEIVQPMLESDRRKRPTATEVLWSLANRRSLALPCRCQ